MGKINQLDFQVANLIAAGEVVERPASCVKELLENSLDAEASEITVEIKRGGVSFIRVADNGSGIAKDDLPIAIKRHATSKIKTAADLDGIMTLGFRGEALAAISSVSNMRIMTKRREDKFASLLAAEYGKVTDIAEVGAKNGTTVIVEGLFANVPARRKFLKRDASEAMAVSNIVEKIAISRPDVAIKLIIDGNLKFATPGDKKLISAIHATLGRDFSEKLVKVRNVTEGIEVIGYISRPEAVRSNRNGQNFFINGRYVKSKTATAALEQGFSSYCEVGKFPSCVLFINVHPTFVDVNVHPTKLEVKFSNERSVFDAVYCAVKNTLSDSSVTGEPILEPRKVTPEERGLYNAFVPIYDRLEGVPTKEVNKLTVFDEPQGLDALPDNEVSLPKSGAFEDKPLTGAKKPESVAASFESQKENTSGKEKPFENAEEKKACGFLESLSSLGEGFVASDKMEKKPSGDFQISDMATDKGLSASSERAFENRACFHSEVQTGAEKEKLSLNQPYRVIGVAFDSYIIVETLDTTLIIDKHAAHERILFERMKLNMKKSREKAGGQILVLPLEIPLSSEELGAVSEFEETLSENGFDFSIDENKVIMTEIPSAMTQDEAKDIVTLIAGRLSEGVGTVEVSKELFYEEALYQASCKAAMKAKIKDTPENIEWLVKEVFSNPDIRYCPHGRPISFELSRRDMEKFFKRT